MSNTILESSPVLTLPSDARRVAIGLGLWWLAATGLALSGAFSLERRALVPAAILSALAMLVLSYRTGGAFRRVCDAVPLRAWVLLHAVRAPIGVGFFVLAVTDGLDGTFTQVAGWGDLTVGLLAVLVSLALPALDARRTRIVGLWNGFAALDIFAVVITAQRALLFSDHPESMSALLRFPGPMLPLVIVPVVIATHALIALRLWRGDRE